MTVFVTAVAMLFLGAVSEPLIYCLIGPKWHEASIYLPYLCIIGVFYPLIAINMNMLAVQGHSGLLLTLEIVKKILELAPLFIGAFVGIVPMLWAFILTNAIGYLLNSYYSGKLLNYSSWMQIKDIIPSLCVALAVALSVWFLKYLPVSNWIVLPMQVFIGTIVFFAICNLFRLHEYQELIDIVNHRKVKK